MSSWVPGAAGSGFDVDHLPYGVFARSDDEPRVGVRIGATVLDLAPMGSLLGLEGAGLFRAATLDPFLAAGPAAWATARSWLTSLLTEPSRRDAVEPFLVPLAEVGLRMPFTVADYVDFYASEHHARRVGEVLRPDAADLPRAWRHLPIGYHGRAGTVQVSGTDVVRPRGLSLRGEGPEYGPSAALDLEAEVGFVVGPGSRPGSTVSTSAFAEHVFGVVLVDDWSARDLQAFEYVPLGPFLGKSFATSVAAWVTPLAALENARVPLPTQQPAPAEHLAVDDPAGYRIDLEVWVGSTRISAPPYASTYWAPAQMLAHLTSNGAALRTGDLFASGTVSGPGDDERGCLLELTHGGRVPLPRADGGSLGYLRDGDTVTVTATAPGASGGRLRLGEVRGTVLPAG